MKRSELKFNYPSNLVALTPQRPSRVLWVKNEEAKELTWPQFLRQFKRGDVIVVNDTKVSPLRIWARPAGNSQESEKEVDLLFVRSLGEKRWEVLAPTKKMKNERWELPEGIQILETTSGVPQIVQLSHELDESYFSRYGEIPLPPYILKARESRKSCEPDKAWYQSIFAKNLGSSAAPTASLHFQPADFEYLKSQGVDFASLTLHVGLGTYLPVIADDLNDHKMHREQVHISKDTWQKVMSCSGRVWALGTTSARAIESAVLGKLEKSSAGFHGSTDLLIQPGYDFKIIKGLLTNFHQPESTLLAMVGAFAGMENVKRAYALAIEKKFRLFSYGDLSAWEA